MSSEDIIKKAYYDPDTGFIGMDKLYRKLKPQGITRFQIKTFVENKKYIKEIRKRHKNKHLLYLDFLDKNIK